MVILVTGATGLTGAAVAEAAARRGHRVVALGWRQPFTPKGVASFHQIDLREENLLTRAVLDSFPDVIINTAAISDARQCEEDPDSAEQLNIRLPVRLADLSRHLAARLLHVSTDMVFDGKTGNYRAGDPTNPQSLYGQMKLAAEREILDRAPEFSTIIRTTLLTGNSPSGKRSVHENLFATWARGETAIMFTDEFRQPCAASNLAAVLVELAERTDSGGLYHWAGAEVLSRLEIGRRILARFQLPENWVRASTRDKHPQHHNRPGNLSLDIGPLAGKLKTKPLDFSAQLDLLKVPPPCREWFNQL